MKFIYGLFILILMSCSSASKKNQTIENKSIDGLYKAYILTQGKKVLFNLMVKKAEDKSLAVSIINGSEIIPILNPKLIDDTLYLPLEVYDAEIKLFVSETALEGTYTRNYVEDYILPVKAQKVEGLANEASLPKANFQLEEKYKVSFENQLKDSTHAVGLFKHEGMAVSGTFLTNSGDYRFLSGNAFGDSIRLSGFDGGFIMLFEAKIDSSGKLSGRRWSGKTLTEKWTAIPDKSVELNATSGLIDVDATIDFSMKAVDEKGDTITLKDSQFDDKIVILQIMGTWCPNCLDEATYLNSWLEKQDPKKVALLGLAFESKDEFSYAQARLTAFKKRLNITYPLLFGGKANFETVQKSMPQLLKLRAYPTLIVVDKNKKVRYLHYGFNGPSTGEYYQLWIRDFNQKMSELID